MNRRLLIAAAVTGALALVAVLSAVIVSGRTPLSLSGHVSSGPSPSAPPPATASATPGGSGATPASTATPVPIAAASCRLPIASGDAPVDGKLADGTAGHGGFLTLPSGTFAVDPASLGSYDRGRSRWLPVFRAWVSPDGSRYVFPEYPGAPGPATGTLHVIDVGTGSDHPIHVPAPSFPLSFEPEGIYAVRVIPNSGAPAQGLIVVDPASGTFRQIVADGLWSFIGGGAAYGADLDSSIPGPGGVGGPGAANRVRRLDLTSGAVTTYASYPGKNVQILGLTSAGTPIVGVTSGSAYTVSAGATIFSGPAGATNPQLPIVVDGSTIWFSSSSGVIWRWDGSGSATQAATTSLPSIQVAGACR